MKKIIYVVAATVTLIAVPPAANAQQADSPKQTLTDKLKQKYLERRANFVRRVKDVYFAAGCKILTSEAGIHSLTGRDSYLAQVQEQTVLDLKEDEELLQAAKQEDAAVEQLKNFAGAGDIYMAISGSGNSPNVIRAMEYANSLGCRTLALTGRDGGKLGGMAELNIQVPEQHMGRIEDAHHIICHMICYCFMDTE